MPWWFWIITHVWVICSTILIIHQIENDEYEGEHWGWKLFIGFVGLMGPIAFIIGICGAIWEEKKVWSKIKDRWLMRKLRQALKWFKNYRKRRQDFKEIEENEDEWTAERVGIKLK